MPAPGQADLTNQEIDFITRNNHRVIQQYYERHPDAKQAFLPLGNLDRAKECWIKKAQPASSKKLDTSLNIDYNYIIQNKILSHHLTSHDLSNAGMAHSSVFSQHSAIQSIDKSHMDLLPFFKVPRINQSQMHQHSASKNSDHSRTTPLKGIIFNNDVVGSSLKKIGILPRIQCSSMSKLESNASSMCKLQSSQKAYTEM